MAYLLNEKRKYVAFVYVSVCLKIYIFKKVRIFTQLNYFGQGHWGGFLIQKTISPRKVSLLV